MPCGGSRGGATPEGGVAQDAAAAMLWAVSSRSGAAPLLGLSKVTLYPYAQWGQRTCSQSCIQH